jgi:hypothetical protein
LSALSSQLSNRQDRERFNAIKKTPLEPQEFCRRWIQSPAPDEYGYYSACVRELAKVCEISERTVQGWGKNFSKRPVYVLAMLRKEDLICQMRRLFDQFDQIEE